MDFKPSTIREGRRLKDTAREQEVNLAGQTSELFAQQISPELELRVQHAVEAHKKWLEREWETLKKSLHSTRKASFDEVLQCFQETLRKRVKLYARTTETPLNTFAKDPRLLDVLFEQAAFDFIMSFRFSARNGETYKNALKIAELSHWLNPMDIHRLGTKYQGKVDEWVLTRAALGYPKDPDAFIDTYLTEVVRLSTKYQGKVDEVVLRYAALNNPKNPDAFIDWYAGVYDILIKHKLKKSDIQHLLFSNAFKPIEQLLLCI